MHRAALRSAWLVVLIILVSLACNFRPVSPATVVSSIPTTPISPEETPAALTPAADRLLTVCMAREPASLFLYSDNSSAARLVRQAIYDGPFDTINFELSPVILTSKPRLDDGSLALAPVSVVLGETLVDVNRRVVKLGEGVTYLPSGCGSPGCAVVYTGQAPVQVDQVTARFALRSGLQWSDGQLLTSDDSLYSYEVALSLFPKARAELLERTYSYTAVDELTVEWKGLPGYRAPEVEAAFFVPLPRHAWGSLAAGDLLTSKLSSRTPLGWGPYQVDEWKAGDHITLTRNPGYFRASENLPNFEKLVFRFVPDREQALTALLAGECDFLDEAYHLEMDLARLQELEQQGKLKLFYQAGTAWELLTFGLLPATTSPAAAGGATPAALSSTPQFFNLREVRQAAAMCLNRESLAAEFSLAQAPSPDAYIPPGHPLLDPNGRKYSYDPQAAAQLLDQAGWKDADNNPATPRLARGVSGVTDGTAFEVDLVISNEAEKQRLAQVLKEMLGACGINLRIDARSPDVAFAAGPEGPIFGRNFTLAQFGWESTVEPPCFLYTTAQIPGPYPQFPLGWGGANATGYSRTEFDTACRQAALALPGTDEYLQAHYQAQAIFAEDLPAIPLYSRVKLVAARPDFCQVELDPSSESALWNLERLDYGASCQP